MKVIVTGASGFVGMHAANYFAKKGNQVIGWDCAVNGTFEWPLYCVDMMDAQIMMTELRKERPDLIIHCAGSADVGKSVLNPDLDYNGNVTLTHNLLFAVERSGLTDCRIIFLSSAAVYGNPVQLPVKEDAEKNPLSPYALHKVMCEEMCYYMCRHYGMDIKILRIFSAYGEGLKKQIFWDMHVKAKKTGRLDMYGTGEESRDYIYIEDLVQAIYLVATKAPKNEWIYNIANGEETSIREATEYFAGVVGIEKDAISFSGVEKEGNPLNWRADISKLKVLGYEKKMALAEGIRKYVDWVENAEK